MNIYFDFQLSFIDFIIVVVLFWAIYRGYARGAIIHSVALLVLLAGIGISSKLSYLIYDLVQSRARVSLYHLPVFIFAFLLVPSVYVSHLVSKKVIGNIGKVPQGMINRMLGIAVNVVKYLYIMSAVLILVYKLDASYDYIHLEEKKRSRLYFPVLSIAPSTFKSLKFPEIHPIPIGKTDYIRRQEENEKYMDEF